LLYIWNKTDTRIQSVDGKIDRIAISLETLEKTTSAEIAKVKMDVRVIERICLERHGHEGLHMHRRAGDVPLDEPAPA